jgi:two-component system, OmpR family, phosphate regulon sensor histidine kinase PhoR
MALTILIITGFQVYWLKKSYDREKRNLEMRTNMMFRETVHTLQAAKLDLDKISIDSAIKTKIITPNTRRDDSSFRPKQKMIALVNALREKAKDSTPGKTIVFERRSAENEAPPRMLSRHQSRLVQFLFEVDSLQDSVTVSEIEESLRERMDQQNMDVPFNVYRIQKEEDGERQFNEVTLGFSNPITYQVKLGNIYFYLLKRIGVPILFSFFLIGFTILSFAVLYNNLLKQRRLADIKNEFISNITHELKTPIATVSVAIEALRSFNATIDPSKTKEYLDISAHELQRLSLLVDKVLKLSMFEKKEMDLQYEPLDLKALVEEVTTSLRLQFERHNATVNIIAEGDTSLVGDRLHLVSVIFNLLDNALKYSQTEPDITIHINGSEEQVKLVITDKGIGIPEEYHEKVFEKFFRVPTGNIHNAKGYGLGLNYVAHVVEKHKGSIKVESVEGEGSNFKITLPKHAA